MNVKEFLKATNKTERERVAAEAETTVEYLYQLAGGHREPSAKLAKRLELSSNGAMTRRELLPDVFA